jgi:hypothetical protein
MVCTSARTGDGEDEMFGEAEGVCVLGTRICIKSITKLVDLEVKYAN